MGCDQRVVRVIPCVMIVTVLNPAFKSGGGRLAQLDDEVGAFAGFAASDALIGDDDGIAGR